MSKQSYKRVQHVTIDGVLHKACNKCGVVQPVTDYHKSKAQVDGHHNTCKPCRNDTETKRSRDKRQDPAYLEATRAQQREYARKRREADREGVNEYQRQWRAANPGKGAAYTRKSYYKHHEKSVARARERYALNPGYFAQWRKDNTDKMRAYTSKWRTANPEYFTQWCAANPESGRVATRKWQLANPEKGRQYGAKRRALKRDATVGQVDYAAIYAAHDDCYLCGGTLVNPVHMDHVIPLARGGAHSVGNLLPAHAHCNLRKHDALLSELDWYRGPVDLGVKSAINE